MDADTWEVGPNKGVGPLRFGMTHKEVARYDDVMGAVDETKEEKLLDGRVYLNEFRDIEALICSFDEGQLSAIRIGESDAIDYRIGGLLLFEDRQRAVHAVIRARRAARSRRMRSLSSPNQIWSSGAS